MKYKHDDQEFIDHLAIWHSKGRTLEGIEVHRLTDGSFQAVVLDYMTGDSGYYARPEPYTTWRGAFAAIGAALDKIERQD
jgi:hypothetical protein